MSYEGYTEYICETGHTWGLGADELLSEEYLTEGSLNLCPFCNKGPVFSHTVDCTNGMEWTDDGALIPGTAPYPFEEVSFEDVWHVDHYGNKFATKIILYKVPEVKNG